MKKTILAILLCLIPFFCDAQQIIVTKKKAGGGGGASYTADFASDVNPLGSPWTGGPTPSNMLSTGGIARNVTTSGWSDMYYNEAAIGDDHYSQAKMIAWGGANYSQPGVTVRNTGSDFYGANIRHDGTRIYHSRYNEGTATAIGACALYTTITVTANDVLRMEASGTTITVKLNGSTVVTCTDSTLSTGKPGILAVGGLEGSVDDWAGGDL